MLFAPVMAGYWRHSEVIDGRYTLDDLLDILEAMHVKAENEWRATEAAKSGG